MDEGQVEVESIESIALSEITDALARESGFENVDDLLAIARHGRGRNVYLIRFHYLPPGGWSQTPASARSRTGRRRPRATRDGTR